MRSHLKITCGKAQLKCRDCNFSKERAQLALDNHSCDVEILKNAKLNQANEIEMLKIEIAQLKEVNEKQAETITLIQQQSARTTEQIQQQAAATFQQIEQQAAATTKQIKKQSLATEWNQKETKDIKSFVKYLIDLTSKDVNCGVINEQLVVQSKIQSSGLYHKSECMN